MNTPETLTQYSFSLAELGSIVTSSISESVAAAEFRALSYVELDNWNIEDDCYLQDLFVVEPARGRGIGRSLIEAVYAEADKRGSPSVYWLTEETNKQARALYDKIANTTSFIEYSR